ncbi:hypothetical protein PRNP1_005813 [Phytophthora ramorum]
MVAFGNPFESSSSTYGSKAIEFCNMGDPVCGGGFNMMAHVTYPMDSVASAAEKADTTYVVAPGPAPVWSYM